LKGIGHSFLWGSTVALSWTWGLGLFFSVQMAMHFGLAGLLGFAIPNAIGLFLFGFLTQRIARKHSDGRSFERHFLQTSGGLSWVFLLYAFTALSLTFFALLKYMIQPLGVDLGLAVLIILGAAVVLGEQFDISRIRFSHGIMLLIIALSLGLIGLLFNGWHGARGIEWGLAPGAVSPKSTLYVGFVIPIIAGLLVGPWLDIQQWQRAIQIHREGGSIQASYGFGSLLFFSIIVAHGFLALTSSSAAAQLGIANTPDVALDGLFHAKASVVKLFSGGLPEIPIAMQFAYYTFLILCVVSTLDSGYISLKWYLRQLVKKSNHLIFSFVPPTLVEAPMPFFLIVTGVAALAVPLGAQLEYFMSFYASFSLGYAVVFLFRSTYRPEFTNFTAETLFAVASFSLGIFGLGFFNEWWIAMCVGALIPLVHGVTVISSRVVVDDLQKALPRPDSTDVVPLPSVSGKAAEVAVQALEKAIARLDPRAAEKFHAVIQRVEPTAAQALASVLQAIQPQLGGAGMELVGSAPAPKDNSHARGHYEGHWFTYSFVATYQDTNSVGNVYFGQYVLWVGKVREMFFNDCMPDFDLKTTDFFILTRSIEHKFNMESREFEMITVQIRVEGFNRKFATLEHQIFNEKKQLLGKGKQVLLFVSAKDYGIVDLPNEVKNAFLPHIG
jgi:acyl-CoA thioesterase FadM